VRVLITSDFFRPFIGGAERQVELLARELAARGHGVDVATVWHDGLPLVEEVDGVGVHRLRGTTTATSRFSRDGGRRFHPPLPDPGITVGLRALIRERQPDVVHANGWIAYSCAAAVARGGPSLLLSVRDYGYSCPTRNLLEDGRRISSGPAPLKCLRCAARQYGPAKAMAAVGGVFAGRPLLRRTVRGVHSVSRFVETIVRRDLLSDPDVAARVRFERIPDIVPSAGEAAGAAPLDAVSRSAVERLPATPYILFVGQLQAHKGLLVLLDAYRRMPAPPPLVLIGTRWPDTPRDLPAGVTLLEDVPHAAVMAAWRGCLFGVAPSVWPDPLPGVVREAMAVGRAVVATDVGGNPDMVEDGRTGILVPPGDAAALCRAMSRLAGDAALRERLGAAAEASVAELTAGAIAGRFEALYGAIARRG
jgi:glycosyltransferase involved in cell wall biosynthesis